MSNFTLSFHIPLEPKQLVMAGGDQDPLGKTFNTAVAEQYEVCLFNPKEPVLPDVDFLLDSDETIVPGMSPGLSIFTDTANLPLNDRRYPERLWKLQKEITNDGELKYPMEIQITRVNPNQGHYAIKPTAPVRPQTFRQMLRCLPWLKMYPFEEVITLNNIRTITNTLVVYNT